MISAATQPLLCSFCRKPQSSVQKLVSSSPSESSSRAYICDACIAVCTSIVNEDLPKPPPEPVIDEGHPLLEHPLASDMFYALEIWIKRESLGNNASEELATIRSIASEMLLEIN